MSRMLLFSVVLYIATRLALDGDVVDESLVVLFGKAGLHLAAREIFTDHPDDGAATVGDTVH